MTTSLQADHPLARPAQVVTAGVELFADIVRRRGLPVIERAWAPPLDGDAETYRRLFGLGGTLARVQDWDKANAQVIGRMLEADPVVIDVAPAHRLIPALRGERRLLHAGPPLAFAEMTGPMQAAAVGAVLFEGWADDPDAARRLLEHSEVALDSCHHHGAVGPMAGITSPGMPLFVVENHAPGGPGNRAFVQFNEGIGPVLRFGANSAPVLERLRWFAQELGPTLGAALRHAGGIALKPLMAKALTMGDEMHQRNAAASLLFLKELLPGLTATAASPGLTRAVDFLAQTDQFFLNLAMAAGKVMGDAGHSVGAGTIVTAMARNGVRFGIRVAGLGASWWTAPVNTPHGMYFAGFSAADANPDIGDSAIMETIGLGGMAMPAAPAVIGFVGAGDFPAALRLFRELSGLVVARNPQWPLPTLAESDGQGALLGIDVRRVIAAGITPLINTGIAHRQPGVGQIGAGTVRAPLAAFEDAARALAVQPPQP